MLLLPSVLPSSQQAGTNKLVKGKTEQQATTQRQKQTNRTTKQETNTKAQHILPHLFLVHLRLF